MVALGNVTTAGNEATGKGLVGNVGTFLNGSSARKVGWRYLFGDTMVALSALIMGNTSKVISSLFGYTQSVSFMLDGEKDKNKMADHASREIDSLLDKAADSLAQKADSAQIQTALKQASALSGTEKLRNLGEQYGVAVGQWSMVGAGATMFHSGLRGRKDGSPIIGEILNGTFNMLGFGLPRVFKAHDKPEGYDRYTVNPDSHLPDFLRGIGRGVGHFFRKPREAIGVVRDMLHYDPSELSKYVLSTTSLWGLLGGAQELLRGDIRSRLSGAVQLVGSMCYLWGELAMGNMSHEEKHGHLGSLPEQDLQLLKEKGFFRQIVDKAIARDFLREGQGAHNSLILDSIATEVVASRNQIKLDIPLIKQGLMEAMPTTYQDFSVDGARS